MPKYYKYSSPQRQQPKSNKNLSNQQISSPLKSFYTQAQPGRRFTSPQKQTSSSPLKSNQTFQNQPRRFTSPANQSKFQHKPRDYSDDGIDE